MALITNLQGIRKLGTMLDAVQMQLAKSKPWPAAQESDRISSANDRNQNGGLKHI